MGKLFNHSWSFTKDRIFRGCRRQFLFAYASSDEPFEHEAKTLKKAITPPMLAGGVVDYVISSALIAFEQHGEIRTSLHTEGLSRLASFWTGSLAAAPRARRWVMPDGPLLLHHYHDLPDDPRLLREAQQRVELCLKNFEASPLWATLQTFKDAKWGSIRLHGSSELPPAFLMQGRLIVYAGYDFHIETGEELVIVDWHTGRVSPQSSKNALEQAAVCALFGASPSGLKRDLMHIRTQAVFLAAQPPSWQPAPVDEALMTSVEARFVQAADELQSLISFQGAWRHGSVYLARKEDFPATPSQAVCPICTYRSICKEGSSHFGPHPGQRTEPDDLD